MVAMDVFAHAFGLDSTDKTPWFTLGKVTAKSGSTLSVLLGGSATPTEVADYCSAAVGDIVIVAVIDGQSRAIACKDGFDGKYLPLSGGTLTGALSGTTADFESIGFTNGLWVKPSADGYGRIYFQSSTRNQPFIKLYPASDANGDAVLLGDGGLTIIGAGEAAGNLYTALNVSPGTESLYLAADSYVHLVPNCNTIANRADFVIGSKGIETPTMAGVSYIEGANGKAALYLKKNTGSVWYPAICLDTTSGGSWQIGNYNDENLKFVWASQANRESSTNSTTAVNLRNVAGTIQLVPTSLYSNTTGTTGTVTLSSSAANFNHMKIYYRVAIDSYVSYGSETVQSPNGKTVGLNPAMQTSTSNATWWTKRVSISGTSITRTNEWHFSRSFDNGSISGNTNSNHVYIYRVEAWNE